MSSCESLLPVEVGRYGFLNQLLSKSKLASFQKLGMTKGNNAGSSIARLYVSKENGNVGFGLISLVLAICGADIFSGGEVSLLLSTDLNMPEKSLSGIDTSFLSGLHSPALKKNRLSDFSIRKISLSRNV